MNQHPLVSILMTAYNRERYIKEAIESVLKLEYPNWELIIVDDCSIDNTVAIAKKYAAQDTRIHVYVNTQNLGDYSNRNKAASYAKGMYIQYLDSDDTIFEDSLTKMVELTKQYPEAGLFMRSLGATIEFFPARESIIHHLFKKQFLYYGPGGIFIKRDFFEQMGGYPEKYGPANDMYFNLKAACETPIVTHPYRTIFYRRHDGQESKAEFTYIIENYRYMRDALNELPLPLSVSELNWLKNKNYRRFITNLFKYSSRKGNFKNFTVAWKKAEFKYSYMLKGIFH